MAIGAATLLLISSVTFYGHQLARQMKLDAQEKEQFIIQIPIQQQVCE